MNTLKEMGDFVGIPQGSLEVARYGGPRITSLGKVSLLVTKRERPASMRAISQTLQNLTPITLEAKIVGSQSGEEPFEPKIRMNASGGITWHTTVEYHGNGNVTSIDVNNSGGDFTPTQLGRGSYQVVVIRSGISNTGFVSLSKTIGIVTVSAPPQPPKPPLPLEKPIIDVQSNGDGSFVVNGSKFSPDTKVNIRVVDAAGTNIWLTHKSNEKGEIKDYPTGRICQRPGNLYFSANDGRSDPQDYTGTLWSETFPTSCPAVD